MSNLRFGNFYVTQKCYLTLGILSIIYDIWFLVQFVHGALYTVTQPILTKYFFKKSNLNDDDDQSPWLMMERFI